MHLEGKALQWHSVFIKYVGLDNLPSWEEYTRLLMDRFGDVCDDPMADLMKLRQQGSVVDYHEEFDSLVSRLELSDEHQLSCFLGGLKHDVQMMVRMFQPQSVRKAFSLAKMYESSAIQQSQGKTVAKLQKNVSSFAPPILSTPAKQSVSMNKPASNRTLTPAFMSERRAKGLCDFCDEPFSLEHNLTHKKFQVHVLEIEDTETPVVLEEVGDDADKIVQPDPIISVNALTGVPNFRTMRVTGYVRKKPLHILIDSGSTHNFLDEQVPKQLGCKIQSMDPVAVTVVDGNKVQIASVVRNFSWIIQNTTFTSDVMLLPLSCCDLVLGIEWLVTLGDITWNFHKLSMEFFVQGKRHVLRGATSNPLQTVKK